MKLRSKHVRLAFRSPKNFLYAARRFLRHTPLGRLDRSTKSGWSFRPQLISINITGRCNLRCEMCMQPRGTAGDDDTKTLNRRGGELSPGEWMHFVDQVASAHPAFYFSGGEPLLYKGLDQILERIKQRGMIAAIVTNGTLLERYAERLVEIGVDNVTVSIDGPREIHDVIRGVPGSFDRTIRGIEALKEARKAKRASFPRLKINAVITPSSLNTINDVYATAKKLGVDEINLQHPIFDTAENIELHNQVFPPTIADAPNPEQQTLDPVKGPGEWFETEFTWHDYRRLKTVVDNLKKRKDGPELIFFPEVPTDKWEEYYLELDHAFAKRCHMPWTTMRLLADGTFEPCLHYVVGNVTDTPPLDLWNSPRMRAFRRNLQRDGLYPACVRCCYRCYDKK